jgi:hypothetical protein
MLHSLLFPSAAVAMVASTAAAEPLLPLRIADWGLLIADFGILAQIPQPKAGQMEEWLLAMAALAAIALLLKNLFVRKPPIEAEFVSRAECKQHHAEMEQDMDDIRKELRALREFMAQKIEGIRVDMEISNERRASVLHTRINDLATSLARVDERTRDLADLKDAVSRVDERTQAT